MFWAALAWHAPAAATHPDAQQISLYAHPVPMPQVSIVPRGSAALGFAQYLPNENMLVTTEQVGAGSAWHWLSPAG